ncbi:enoyl-CoA hydratase/isomerase family protein [Novosphingobium pentaromativorans]|uniref:Enoyl-CoA hydratase/carnithine racemase n=1 Tax=Novosphingobium pentaromativorans US6-1 TaxID=1088721 RepID=G6E7W8_9SPHN|nr:enoyl-CoA hydratase-related protein [Novosphingobium pentaromativorans]AIT81509.1 enoyl-CoA hydratase [Novosphingobium pentaromativorans US6-1]EHJ62611.1 enoyl-CoA hydratase/carnithine racemase [Novosphingobium pentaromativorans US6-1]
MTFTTLRYDVQDHVAVITYDRQERRNAWGLAMYREVHAAVERANADDTVGAIVLTHEGPIFCAGTDFKDGPHEKDPATGIRPNMATESMALDRSWLHLLAAAKPVIAAVNGKAIGAGVTQLLPTDIRVSGQSSTYSFPFLELGFMPELGCTALLPRLVGYGRAVDLCLTAATLTAAEALNIGLVSRVVPDDDVLSTAMKLATKIAGYPRRQVSFTRRLLRENYLEEDLNRILGRETEAFRTVLREAKAKKAARQDREGK